MAVNPVERESGRRVSSEQPLAVRYAASTLGGVWGSGVVRARLWATKRRDTRNVPEQRRYPQVGLMHCGSAGGGRQQGQQRERSGGGLGVGGRIED